MALRLLNSQPPLILARLLLIEINKYAELLRSRDVDMCSILSVPLAVISGVAELARLQRRQSNAAPCSLLTDNELPQPFLSGKGVSDI